MHDTWHKTPEVKARRAKTPKLKVWKLGLTTDHKIALVSLTFTIFGAAYAAVTFHKGEESKKSEDPNDKNSGSKESRNPHNEDSAIAEPVAGNSEQQTPVMVLLLIRLLEIANQTKLTLQNLLLIRGITSRKILLP